MAKGKGSPGYCKICDHPAGPFLNRKYEANPPPSPRSPQGFNAARAQEFALELGLTFNRQTWYAHVDHITHPLITKVREAQQNPVVVPKTNVGVLEAIRDLGIKRAIENPDEVTVDHALKAAAELNRKQSGTDNVLIVFAKVLSGEATAEELVGEFRELPVIAVPQEELPVG